MASRRPTPTSPMPASVSVADAAALPGAAKNVVQVAAAKAGMVAPVASTKARANGPSASRRSSIHHQSTAPAPSNPNIWWRLVKHAPKLRKKAPSVGSAAGIVGAIVAGIVPVANPAGRR